jgi:hypothetical protein
LSVQRITSLFGFIAVLSGIVRLLMTPSALIWGPNSMPELWAGLTACWLMAIGGIGLYLFQAPRTGVLGLIGCLLLSLGNMITGCLVWSTMLNAEPTDAVLFIPMANNIVMLAGLIVFAAVTFRAGLLPRWASVLLLVWPFIGYLPFMGDWMTLFWGAAYAGLGYPVWRNGSGSSKKYVNLQQT